MAVRPARAVVKITAARRVAGQGPASRVRPAPVTDNAGVMVGVAMTTAGDPAESPESRGDANSRAETQLDRTARMVGPSPDTSVCARSRDQAVSVWSLLFGRSEGMCGRVA